MKIRIWWREYDNKFLISTPDGAIYFQGFSIENGEPLWIKLIPHNFKDLGYKEIGEL